VTILSDAMRGAKQTMMASVSQTRHHLKGLITRSLAAFGVSFPDAATSVQEFLDPVAPGVYQVKQGQGSRVTRSGVIGVGSHFLSIDYGAYSVLRPSYWRSRGPRLHFPAVLPLWSHDWAGYYHWLIDIAPKIATAQRDLGASAADLVFLYPGKLGTFEVETIELLGLPQSRIINLHETGGVTADTIYAMPLPGFFRVHPRVCALRSALGVERQPCRRLYVSRRGRRRIENEEALVGMLDGFGFEFIADVPRSVTDQIEMFAAASHIVTPHGAALSNLIWGSRDTRILELASALYAPEYFGALAAECDMNYKRLVFGAGVNTWTSTAVDFTVDVDAIRRFIAEEWLL
jgi:capsular polysaccharide biosynthesis protein